jgi:hypothetical protein
LFVAIMHRTFTAHHVSGFPTGDSTYVLR